jgi:hypothetical protein
MAFVVRCGVVDDRPAGQPVWLTNDHYDPIRRHASVLARPGVARAAGTDRRDPVRLDEHQVDLHLNATDPQAPWEQADLAAASEQGPLMKPARPSVPERPNVCLAEPILIRAAHSMISGPNTPM